MEWAPVAHAVAVAEFGPLAPVRIDTCPAARLMIVAGMIMAGAAPRRALIQIERLGAPRLYSRTVGRLIRSQSTSGRLALGTAMGFLPCGLLYAALLKSVASGSALAGALSMLAFGFGTAVSLLALGLFSTAIRPRLGRWSRAVTAMSAEKKRRRA